MESRAGSRRFVLAVAEHPWPSTSGGQLRTAAIAEVLAQFGEVTVISLNMPEPPASFARALDRYWVRRHSQVTRLLDLGSGIARGNHVSLQRAIAARVHQEFANLVSQLRPDAVVLGRPFFGPFVARARAGGSACVIIDADESLVRVSRSIMRSGASPYARSRAFLDLLSAGRMERRDFRVADQIWAGSRIEAAGLARAAAGVPISIVPNVVSRVPPQLPDSPPIEAIGFVGSFRHPPNEEAAIELMSSIMPAIRASGGPNELVLIGREPTERIRRRAAALGGVRVTGEVADTSVVLREAGVLVSPIRSGGGTRLKVLDAAANGVPIVTTAFGIDGLDLRADEDVLVAETPEQFATAVARLRQDPLLRERLVRGARAYLDRHHSVAALGVAIETALNGCWAR